MKGDFISAPVAEMRGNGGNDAHFRGVYIPTGYIHPRRKWAGAEMPRKWGRGPGMHPTQCSSSILSVVLPGGIYALMNSMLASLAILVLVAVPAHARLGDSQMDSGARYGIPVGMTNTVSYQRAGVVNRTYNYQGWRLKVMFLDDVAVHIEYQRSGISTQEVHSILAAEQAYGPWTEVSYHRWKSSGGAVALVDYSVAGMTVYSPAYTRWKQPPPVQRPIPKF